MKALLFRDVGGISERAAVAAAPLALSPLLTNEPLEHYTFIGAFGVFVTHAT